MQNKRGQLGMSTATAFIIGILLLAIVGFVTIIALSTLANTPAAAIKQPTVTFTDETTTSMNATGYQISNTVLLNSCTATLTTVELVNGTTVGSGNFSLTNCFVNASTASGVFLNAAWNLTGTYESTSDDDIQNSMLNVTAGIVTLFASANTWFALIAVVIIILIIAIVILAVNRFGGREGTSSDF